MQKGPGGSRVLCAPEMRSFTVATATVWGSPNFAVFVKQSRCVQSPFALTLQTPVMDAIDVPGFGGEAALIDEVRQRLVRRYSHVPEDQVSVTVAQAHARFAQSRVRDFIPLLVERRAGAELAAAETSPSNVTAGLTQT